MSYVHAVAAGAGYSTAECDFDRDAVDLRIHAGGAMRPALDLQLKATVNLTESQDGRYRLPLRRRNYDLLRDETQTPRPMTSVVDTFRFADVPILNEAARGFRSQEPQLNKRVFGIVRRLSRDVTEDDGTIAMKASIDGKNQSVVSVLSQSDYQKAVHAHGEQVAVVLEGDLERDGQRWRLLNPRLVDVITDEDAPDEV